MYQNFHRIIALGAAKNRVLCRLHAALIFKPDCLDQSIGKGKKDGRIANREMSIKEIHDSLVMNKELEFVHGALVNNQEGDN